MRTLLSLLLIISLSTQAQNTKHGYGFGTLSAGALVDQKGNAIFLPSAAFGIGLNKNVFAGAGFYAGKNHATLNFDIRAVLKGIDKSSLFFAAEPGLVITNDGILKGGSNVNLLAGFMSKSSKNHPGIVFNLGYSRYTLRSTIGNKTTVYPFDCFLISGGIKF